MCNVVLESRYHSVMCGSVEMSASSVSATTSATVLARSVGSTASTSWATLACSVSQLATADCAQVSWPATVVTERVIVLLEQWLQQPAITATRVMRPVSVAILPLAMGCSSTVSATSVPGLGVEQLVTTSVAAGTVSAGNFHFMLTDLGVCTVCVELWPVSNDGPGHLVLLW